MKEDIKEIFTFLLKIFSLWFKTKKHILYSKIVYPIRIFLAPLTVRHDVLIRTLYYYFQGETFKVAYHYSIQTYIEECEAGMKIKEKRIKELEKERKSINEKG